MIHTPQLPGRINKLPFVLIQLNGQHSGKNHIIPARNEGEYFKATLGRATAETPVEVSITEPTVSRKHAELQYNGETLLIRHLSQMNQILLNGKMIPLGESAYLKVKDVITLADIQLKLEIEQNSSY